MDSIFFKNNIRIWKDFDDGSIKFLIIRKNNNAVKTPNVTTQENIFSFMMPYIYELAYYEANGQPFSSEYYDAISFQEAIESWLKSRIGHSEMTLTEARLVLTTLYLPTTSFSSI